jgi:hypothetical protein
MGSLAREMMYMVKRGRRVAISEEEGGYAREMYGRWQIERDGRHK